MAVYVGHRRRRVSRYIIFGVLVFCCIYAAWKNLFVNDRKPPLQYQLPPVDSGLEAQSERLEAVKAEFYHAWQSYKFHGWMSDSLRPISGTTQNECGWATTILDSLDTLYIMGLDEDFDYAVEAIAKIDFEANTDSCEVNFLESTTRHLGGLVAAYDLSADGRLRPKIDELGKLLYSAFNTTTGMPCSRCSLGKSKTDTLIVPDKDIPLADTASFSLEFLRLWLITGDEKYLEKVLSISETFQKAQTQSSIPGLWPERLDATSVYGPNARFVSSNNRYSLGALSDSAYEYLVKTHLLLGRTDDRFAQMWHKAAAQIRNHLLFHAYIPDKGYAGALFAGIATTEPGEERADVYLEPRTEHLACFAGGMFALSFLSFHDPEDLSTGKALALGCVWAYESAPMGIMPETFTLLPCTEPYGSPCGWNQTSWDAISPKATSYPPGFVSSIDSHYGLRPEAVESIFVLFRVTGDSKWRDIGWRMFQDIIKYTRSPYGHAALSDVMSKPSDQLDFSTIQKDEMNSVWFAATLKYFYLLFSDTDLISLDEFVLNTQGHPFKLANRR